MTMNAYCPPLGRSERDVRSGKAIVRSLAVPTKGPYPILARLVVAVAMFVAFTSAAPALAQPPGGPVVRAVSVQGTVEGRRAGQTSWQSVRLNDTFSPGDTIRVRDRSRADLAMLDQSVLRLNANTELTVEPVKDARTGVVSLLRGAAHFFSRGPRSLEVQTPFTVAGVRGTEFFIGLEPDRALLTVFEGTVRRSLESYVKGDIGAAFDAIAAAPPTITDPRFFTYRAHLLLTVGRVDEAAADIERALRLAPNDPDALALQTVVAVTQGDKDVALATAQRAVQAAPKAATLAPTLSRPQTVLGYAYLMEVKTKRAKESFEKAITLDSADPLPRLGLGLAKIREGQLHGGSRDIEAAASLDPNNAIVRSYLGKAYYEEKRTGLDEREYAVARQLDPNDPTPHLYDAIAKQTTNRPVEALQAMQRAIELNDNRAIYRSRLLLDADEAARGAAQGRVYSDLGFEPLALVEGWKSVNLDPTSFSAHRLLADTYASLPRHEIARVSELLQSQLLQPLNTTPIQPRLAESNLFLISAGGPGSLSFN